MTVPPPPRPISLAKIATVLATVFMVAFGLCAVTALTGGLRAQKLLPLFIWPSMVIAPTSLVGLLVVGVIAFLRSLKGQRKS